MIADDNTYYLFKSQIAEHPTEKGSWNTSDMLGVLVSFFALAIAFGALWYAGEANKHAEFQHKKFYGSHIRGLAETVNVMVNTVKEISVNVQRL